MEKRIFGSILILVGLLALIIACTLDAEDDLITVFPFTISEDYEGEGYIYEDVETSLSIEIERHVEGTEYYFIYDIIEGSGVYQDQDGNSYPELDSIPLSGMENKFSYIPHEVGTHRVNAKVFDNNGQEDDVNLAYSVDYAPFSIVLNKGSETFIINGENRLELSILKGAVESESEDAEFGESYSMSYLVDNGIGTTKNLEPLENSDEEEMNDGIRLAPGSNELIYVPETLGEHTVFITVEAPDGGTRTESMIVNVEHLGFDLITTGKGDRVELDTELPITLNLRNDNEGSSVTYELSHEIEGSGQLLNAASESLEPGSVAPLTIGEHTFRFISGELGENTIQFTVRDSNGQEKIDSVAVQVDNVPFTFTGSGESNTVTINQETGFNFNLQADGNTENIAYFLSYEISEGNGQLLDANGNIIAPTTPLEIPLGNTSFKYIPSSLERHTIDFKVTDAHGQESSTVSIDLEAEHVRLTYNLNVAQTEMFVKLSNEVTIGFTEEGDYPGVIYELSHFITGGTANLYDNDNNLIPSSFYLEVLPGEYDYTFVPELPGNYTITFQLRDSNGQLLTRVTNVVARQTDFSVTGDFGQSAILLGNTSKVNVNISPTAIENGAGYSMTYSSSLNGSLEYNGTVYSPGETITVNTGQTSATYAPDVVGDHNLDINVTDSNGVMRNVEMTLSVENGEYLLSASASPTEFYRSESTTISMDLTQSVEDPSASYEVSYTTSSSVNISENGNPIPAGTFVPISLGATAWEFSSNTTGAVSLDLTIRDNANVEKERTLTFTVNPNDYSMQFLASKNTEFINVGVPININISELAAGANSTFEMYVSGTLNGRILHNGNSYGYGERFQVNSGNDQLTFIGEEEGNHKITATVESSSGIVKSETTEIDYATVAYTLGASAGSTSLTLDDTTSLGLNIIETAGSSTYQIKFSFLSGNGQVSNGQNVLQQGIYYAIPTGASSWDFLASTVGTANIQFTALNATGEEETANVTIDVDAKDYNLTVVETQSSVFINETVGINTTLTELDSGGETYTAYYTTSGSGELTFNGNSYAPGASFALPVGFSTLNYTGFGTGNHNIILTVTSSRGLSKTNGVQIRFDEVEFNLGATVGANPITVGDQTSMGLNITETSGSSTYQVKYTFLSGNGTITDGASTLQQGVYYGVPTGATTWNFLSTIEGSVTIQFTAMNATGGEETANVTINVDEKDFSLTAVPASNSAFVGSTIDIITTLTELDNGGEIYTAYYSNSSSGVLSVNGNAYLPGQQFPIAPGNTTIQYSGNGEGTHQISITATSSAALSRTANVSMEFDYVEYTLTANEADPTLVEGETGLVNFSINESYGSSNYTMKYQFLSGSPQIFDHNGSSVDPGIYYNVPKGGFNWTIEANSAQSVTIQFTTINETGLEKTAIANFTYSQYKEPFTLNITQNSGIKLSGESFDMTLFITAEDLHNTGINYSMRFVHDNENTGYVIYNGITYTEGEVFAVSHGASTFQFHPTTTTNFDFNMEFIVENSTGEEEDATENIELYQRPVLTNIRTGRHKYNETSCKNGCNWDNSYLVDFEISLDPSATGGEAVIRAFNSNDGKYSIGWANFDLNPATANERSGYYEFFYDHFVATYQAYEFNEQSYQIVYTDNNGVDSILYTGTFTDDDSDSQ